MPGAPGSPFPARPSSLPRTPRSGSGQPPRQEPPEAVAPSRPDSATPAQEPEDEFPTAAHSRQPQSQPRSEPVHQPQQQTDSADRRIVQEAESYRFRSDAEQGRGRTARPEPPVLMLPEPVTRLINTIQHHITPSQGLVLFFSALSLLFASLASFFFWQNRYNEAKVRNFQDQLRVLHEQTGLADTAAHKKAVDDLTTAQHNTGPADNPASSSSAPAPDSPGAADEENIRKMERQMLNNGGGNAGSASSPQGSDSSASAQPPAPGGAPPAQPSESADAAQVRIHDLFATFVSGDDIRLFTAFDGRPGLHIAFSYLFNQGEVIVRPQARLFLARLGKDSAPLLATHQFRIEVLARTRTPSHFAPSQELAFGRASGVARLLVENGNVLPTRIITAVRGDVSAEAASRGRAPESIDIFLDTAPAPAPAASASPHADSPSPAPAPQPSDLPSPTPQSPSGDSTPLLVPPTLPAVDGDPEAPHPSSPAPPPQPGGGTNDAPAQPPAPAPPTPASPFPDDAA